MIKRNSGWMGKRRGQRLGWKLRCAVKLGLAGLALAAGPVQAKAAAADAPAIPKARGVPAWGLGPFERLVDHPVIAPNPASTFPCPMRKKPVHWEAQDTFNPAAVVFQNKICVLYRAEDDTAKGLGARTSRLGLATSEDGIHFERRPEPVFYPADDDYKASEWYGGCEDPRVVEGPDNRFYVYYSMYQRNYPDPKSRMCRIGVASSPDLVHWTKHGPIFQKTPRYLNQWQKSGSVVTSLQDGRLKAVRINGKYWMYWGEKAVMAVSSDDLIHWTPVTDAKGYPTRLISPRKGYFDSSLTECGPPAVLTEKGIVLIYNGRNLGDDTSLGARAYAPGQVLFDAADPTRVLERCDTYFMKPELPFEKKGQYGAGTVFTEGLVYFKNRWFLYYGTADSFVGVAATPVSGGQ
jgi:predicted GH43/DUF377 family glycosyl hydrolase